MKKTHDTALIFTIIILLVFAIFTIIYAFKGNNIKDNNEFNNVQKRIYHEHTTETTQNSNPKNAQKTLTDIASYTTQIYDKDENRVYNIKLACQRLDGHIVKANEEFSFNETMGKMNAEDGYKKSIGFDSNGNKIQMYGGGICQISSTLYNALLIADLKVTERHAHSRRVYYVPKNKDATVFYGGPDLKFINNSNSDIIICVSTDGYTVTVTLKQEKLIDV